MFAFLRTWIRKGAVGEYRDSEAVLSETIIQVKRMRQEMALLYEELELGMAGADQYCIRLEAAKQRMNERLQRQASNEPATFNRQNRQRMSD